ncbi:MAG: copper amine oxidase N-terminal domain-containing protein, partial [Dictyoglomi bacterium]|nr:copper amine oxidase N-terminal domain-containing protein [Dictyoglomota bacterium]
SKDDVDTGILMPFIKEQTQEIPAVPSITNYPETTTVATVTIKGTTDDKATYVEVSVNDNQTYKADVNNQSFEVTVTLQAGSNSIKARACNDAGCSDWSQPVIITYEKEAQKIPAVPTLDPLPSMVYQPYITVSGKTDNLATKVEVFVGGEKYDATVSNQRFSIKVSLYAGENTISARACNNAGCSDFTKEVVVKYVTEVPAPVLSEPSTTTFYNTDTIEISGSSEVAGTLKVYVNGEEKVSQDVSKGIFTVNVPVSIGENYIKAKVCVNETICSDFSNTLVITVKQRTVIEMWVGKAVYTKNGVQAMMDAAPFIMPPGRTVVPLRFVAEGLGFDVKWNGTTRQITITGKDVNNNDTTVIISMPYDPKKKIMVGKRTVYPGSSKVTVIKNGIKEIIDLKNYKGQNMGIPVIYSGRTYVPVRFITEIFGAQVLWDGKEYKITIIFER